MRLSDAPNNIIQIEALSQRGRTLSIVDLLHANTLSVEMAAHLFCLMGHGASFLTAAKPGNAGKTTLMACILMFLPPGTRIVTVSDPSIISQSLESNRDERVCYLCHEIGGGNWYGYLWGDDVGNFFNLQGEHRSIASCIHADTLDEMKEILFSDELNVVEADFSKVDLILFMRLERNGWEYTRRVSSFYEKTDISSQQSGSQIHESHRPLFIWDKNSDTFHQQGDSLLLRALARHKGIAPNQMQRQLVECGKLLRWLIEQGINDYRRVHQEIRRFYEEGDYYG